MRIASHLDHVTLLVASVTNAAARVKAVGEAQPLDEFPADGTKEIYVGRPEETARLLLVEPMGDGSYRRALDRRGPGLHHVGLLVDDVEDYVAGLAGTGWFLLPQSLASLKSHRTAWLARPGTKCLVEVHERPAPKERKPLITTFELPPNLVAPALVEALGCPALVSSKAAKAVLSGAVFRIQLNEITD